MTASTLTMFVDLGDECDGCHATRWPSSMQMLDFEWLSARYECRRCSRSWSVGWPNGITSRDQVRSTDPAEVPWGLVAAAPRGPGARNSEI